VFSARPMRATSAGLTVSGLCSAMMVLEIGRPDRFGSLALVAGRRQNVDKPRCHAWIAVGLHLRRTSTRAMRRFIFGNGKW